jgi:hypothetical protein
MEEENIELQLDWELGAVEITAKNWVIYDNCNEIVKCLRLNLDLPMKPF